MKRVITVIGTRPEIIKMSCLLPALDESFDHFLVHTGQHYSTEMDQIFFSDLQLKAPQVNLKTGGLRPLEQLGTTLIKLDEIFNHFKPDVVIVHGDTNTTLAAAIAASKYRLNGVKLVHVEAGGRSGNVNQPEEMNRMLVDRMSDLLFVSSENDLLNLKNEGIDVSKCVVTGNTIIEVCSRVASFDFKNLGMIKNLVGEKMYAVMTLHRQETVDFEEKLRDIINGVNHLSKAIDIIFLIHPRTRSNLKKFNLELNQNNIHVIEPMGYVDTVNLVKRAKFCITDSGGLQEECAFLNVPALVAREETECVDYVNAGLLQCTGSSGKLIFELGLEIIKSEKKIENNKIFFNLKTTEKIISEIKKIRS